MTNFLRCRTLEQGKALVRKSIVESMEYQGEMRVLKNDSPILARYMEEYNLDLESARKFDRISLKYLNKERLDYCDDGLVKTVEKILSTKETSNSEIDSLYTKMFSYMGLEDVLESVLLYTKHGTYYLDLTVEDNPFKEERFVVTEEELAEMEYKFSDEKEIQGGTKHD